MSLYTKADFERHTMALDFASQCVSAAIAGENYGIRLKDVREDLVEIVSTYKLEDSRREKLAQIFLELINGNQISGIQSLDFTKSIDQAYEHIKGKLLGTRMMLADGDKKRKNKAAEHLKAFRATELAE